MGTVVFPDNISVRGTAILASVSLPASVVSNANVAAGAAIATDKLRHKHRKTYAQSGTAASVTIPIHHVIGATADNLSCKAGSIAIAVGAATVTIDLKKNGTTVLTGVTTLDTGNTARVGEALGVNVFSAVTGDLYELVITATAGGGTLPTGLFVEFEIDEDES